MKKVSVDADDDGIEFDDVTHKTGPSKGRLETAKNASSGEMKQPQPTSIGSFTTTVLEDLSHWYQIKQEGGYTGGLRCGFPIIDDELRGFRPGTVTFLNAEPNIGKSTLSNQIAYDIAAHKEQSAIALYVTFENGGANLTLKHISRRSGWSVRDLESGDVDPSDPSLLKAIEILSEVRLFYLEGNSTVTPDYLIEVIEQLRKLVGADCQVLLVIDYLQKFARCCSAKNEYEQLGATLSELRRIAEETNAALFVIGSQNRETNRTGGGPTMFGGRGSGEIEYDADTILVLSREKFETDVEGGNPDDFRKLTAVKTRFGGAGVSSVLFFNKEAAQFISVDDYYKQAEETHAARTRK